jgi:hypothetical protein
MSAPEVSPADDSHGMLAMFDSPEALQRAAARLRAGGYVALDAFTPFPVEGLAEALGYRGSPLPWIMLAGGIAGFAGLFGLEAYSVLVNYPLDVGGRPLFSWPAFVIPAFETGILGAALCGFFGMLALNGLPKLYHPVFNAPSFTLARDDKFYLLVASTDPHYDRARLRRLFRALGAAAIEQVTP